MHRKIGMQGHFLNGLQFGASGRAPFRPILLRPALFVASTQVFHAFRYSDQVITTSVTHLCKSVGSVSTK